MIVEPRLTYRWHELLKQIDPSNEPPSDFILKRGKAIHASLEKAIGTDRLNEVEYRYTSLESGLPFDIFYHPDVVRQEAGPTGAIRTYIYEIKSLIWFIQHRTVCEAQLSGYVHFSKAYDGSFLLYQFRNGDFRDLNLSLFPLHQIPWEALKQVAIRAHDAYMGND